MINLIPKINQNNTQQQLHMETTHQTVIITSAAKLHRATMLARIINSVSIIRESWAFGKVKNWAAIKSKRYNKMGFAINRIFRRSFYELKFGFFQKIKKELLVAEEVEITQSQKVIKSMSKASKSIIFVVLKAKRREILSESFMKVKNHSMLANFDKRNGQRKSIKKILNYVLKDKRYAFDKICTSNVNLERKLKIKNVFNVLLSLRKSNLTWGIWKLRKNLQDQKRVQVENDIKLFEAKIINSNDPDISAIQEKKSKLEEHYSKIQKEKMAMEEEFTSEQRELEKQKETLETTISQLEQRKLEIANDIQTTEEQIASPFSIDEIYQCVYNNFLLYLHENKEQVYIKEQILQSLTIPLIPIDAPIDIIKKENKVMNELLNEYVVMFGPKMVTSEVKLPYEYLVKENQVMYKMLVTLLPQIEGDRDDLRVLRDSLFKLNSKVNEFW